MTYLGAHGGRPTPRCKLKRDEENRAYLHFRHACERRRELSPHLRQREARVPGVIV